MSVQARSLIGRVGYRATFGICLAVATGWLVLGGTAAVLRYWPGLLDPSSASGDVDHLLVAASRATNALGQLLVDDGLSLVGIAAAVVLAVMGTRSWSIRLLALALVSSAGAFNLQSDAVATVLDQATGLPIGATRDVALRPVACVAFILALLFLPTGSPAGWWRAGAAVPNARVVTAALVSFLLVAIGVTAPLLPCALSCVLLFGLVVPMVGIVVLTPMVRRGPNHRARSQARLVLAVMVATIASNGVLGLCTGALSALGAPGLALAGEPGAEWIGPLFWSARASAISIAAVVLLAVLPTRAWEAERVVGQALVPIITTVVVGATAVSVEAVASWLSVGDVLSSLTAAAAAGVVFLPVHLLAEGITDRLLYGVRPTPYRALADVTHVAQASARSGPDLDDVARAVGHALGARDCRITVVRHSLADRTYQWSADAEMARPLVSVPIRYGDERIGTLAVERAALAGLHVERRQLLDDIADGLGGIVAAHRTAVELERQLRATLAHATEIARSRRRAVAEMDAERRRIERDLHDGVQHQLVSLRLTLGLVEFEVGNGRLDSAILRLQSMTGRLDTAEAVLAETVGGVQSVLLGERGLIASLEAEFAGMSAVSVVAELSPDSRYPAEVESSLYFCCLESVGNAAKHAPGAAVVVRFVESDGWLQFSITDDGPGFDPQVQPEEPSGRGLSNMRQRIVHSGGWIEVRSAPGAGTTVVGAVPVGLPTQNQGSIRRSQVGEEATTVLRIAEPQMTENNVRCPPRAGQVSAQGGTLVSEVRALVAAAHADFGPAIDADLATVEVGLRRPLRVGLLLPEGADIGPLVSCLFPTALPPGFELDAAPAVGPEGVDALLVVDGVRGSSSSPSGLLTIIAVDTDQTDASPSGAQADRAYSGTVVRVGLRIACAATQLNDAEYAALRIGRPVAALGSVGNRIGLALARESRNLAELRTELVFRSGVPLLGATLQREVFDRADLLHGRRAVARLTQIVTRLPPSCAAERLRYGLEHMMTSRPEFAESALLDDLRGGRVALTGPYEGAALRLLGASGSEAPDRLGLSATTSNADVEVAARAELARWRQLAANPLSSGGQRQAAAVLVQVCERILARRPAE
jgi:signal transduction histidine kinase